MQSVSADELDALCSLLDGFSRAHGKGGAAVEISGDLPSHQGLGAGTALRLAMLEACSAIWGVRATPAELVSCSKRGGTSGIGIRSYFEGGLIVDLGHRRTHSAAPSRDRGAAGAPLQLLRTDMPMWRFGVACPAQLGQVDINAERAVFANAIPLPQSDVHATLYHALFGVVGGALDGDKEAFVAAVDALQKQRWKASEWKEHGQVLSHIAVELRAAGARGIGLSSMGPSLYFLEGLSGFREADCPVEVRWVTPLNHGRVLRMIPDD